MEPRAAVGGVFQQAGQSRHPRADARGSSGDVGSHGGWRGDKVKFSSGARNAGRLARTHMDMKTGLRRVLLSGSIARVQPAGNFVRANSLITPRFAHTATVLQRSSTA